MSLDQYNKLMSDMLNERHALAKLRAKLEEREEKLYWHCKRFEHVAQKCRSGKEETKKINPQNRFEVLKSRVMQCGVKELRRQEKVKVGVRCFKYEKEGVMNCPNLSKSIFLFLFF